MGRTVTNSHTAKGLDVRNRVRSLVQNGLREMMETALVQKALGSYDDGQTSDTVSGSGPKDTIRRIMNRVARCVFLNRTLPAPTEFVRVVVISPGSSAGLGDFRAEFDRFQRAGLCPAGRSGTTRWRPWPTLSASRT